MLGTAQSWCWYKAELPQRFLRWSLDSSPFEGPVKGRLAESDSQQSWLLWGEHGVGKTGLAVGWLRHLMGVDVGELWEDDDHVLKGRFVTLPGLLSKIKATYGPDGRTSEADVLQVYREVPVLVIDDMGAEHVRETAWLAEKLYQVIGSRHDDLKPTLFTSNLSPQELAHHIGERVMWRLTEACGDDGIIELRGPNLRAGT